MPLTLDSPSAAARQAQQNWHANLPALAITQPHLAELIRDIRLPLQWIFARDGALTALDSADQWLANCSLPRRASEQMLRTLQSAGHACFAFPFHPVQLDVALASLPPNCAIHAILPEPLALAAALHCCDFSAAIRSHRLFFAPGPDWPDQLVRTLRQYPGLPIPQNLVRTISLQEDEKATVFALAQRIFSQITEEHAQQRAQLLAAPPPPRQFPPRICLLAPATFHLWEDAPLILTHLLTNGLTPLLSGDENPPLSAAPISQPIATPHGTIHHLNSDDPATSSHLALTRACRDCNALVTANCTRADFADAIPLHTPVIAWLTTPHIPPFAPAMAHDTLLLADPAWLQHARAVGWPAERLAPAAWPVANTPSLPPASTDYLAIIADTTDITQPPHSFELSSHSLLWDLLTDELRQDPFVLAGDIHQYLASRIKRLGIQQQGLDRHLFLERLILPAYQQGLARLLLQADLPLCLFGRTWPDLPEFAPHAQGPISSRAHLLTAAASARALIHVWPATHAHPIESLARPVLTPYTLSRTAFLQSARRLLAAPTSTLPPTNPLTPALLASFLPHP